MFTLTIIHFKRAQDRGARILDGPEDGVIGGPVSRNVLKARRFTSSWSMDFGWGGVTLCALASVAWILLSKIMRFPHSRYDSVAVGGLRGLRSFPTVMKERFDVVASSNMFQICGGRIAFVHNGKQVTENDCVVYFVLIGK